MWPWPWELHDGDLPGSGDRGGAAKMGLISEGEIRGRLAELDNKITNSEMATTILSFGA